MQLFHVSEDDSISEFVPRLSSRHAGGISEALVWSVDERHLVNYLLPRDCPRVTFAATSATTIEDRTGLIGPTNSPRVVAIERDWLDRVQTTPLWVYRLPGETFELQDSGAGYHVSREIVVPFSKTRVANPLQELLNRGVELRVLPTLWQLHDAVAASTLEFSCIRMRNAVPR